MSEQVRALLGTLRSVIAGRLMTSAPPTRSGTTPFLIVSRWMDALTGREAIPLVRSFVLDANYKHGL